MSEVPKHIIGQAQALVDAIEAMPSEGNVTLAANFLLAAEKRGKEEAAKIAERDADWSRFGKGEVQEAWEGGADAARDYRLGIVSGRAIAAAIRGS